MLEILLVNQLKSNERATDPYKDMEGYYSFLYLCLLGVFVILQLGSFVWLCCFWYVSPPSIVRVISLAKCTEFDFLPAAQQAAATSSAMSATL